MEAIPAAQEEATVVVFVFVLPVADIIVQMIGSRQQQCAAQLNNASWRIK